MSNNPDIKNSLLTVIVSESEAQERSVFYDKYAPTLFGYIVSIAKDKKLGEVILSTVFSEIFQPYSNYNLKNECMLLMCIQIANRSIHKMYKIDRKLIASNIFPRLLNNAFLIPDL